MNLSDPEKSTIGGKKYFRVRSYAILCYMNGEHVGLTHGGYQGYMVHRKTEDITKPGPSAVFVFLNEHQNSIDDGRFAFNSEGDRRMNLRPVGRVLL